MEMRAVRLVVRLARERSKNKWNMRKFVVNNIFLYFQERFSGYTGASAMSGFTGYSGSSYGDSGIRGIGKYDKPIVVVKQEYNAFEQDVLKEYAVSSFDSLKFSFEDFELSFMQDDVERDMMFAKIKMSHRNSDCEKWLDKWNYFGSLLSEWNSEEVSKAGKYIIFVDKYKNRISECDVSLCDKAIEFVGKMWKSYCGESVEFFSDGEIVVKKDCDGMVSIVDINKSWWQRVCDWWKGLFETHENKRGYIVNKYGR